MIGSTSPLQLAETRNKEKTEILGRILLKEPHVAGTASSNR